MAAEIIRGKVCRKLYNEGSGWHHLNPQIKHNGTKCRTTTHYEVLMGWHKQHPVLHMKWKKKVKAKTRSINLQRKKKKETGWKTPQEAVGQIQNSGCPTGQIFEFLLSNQRHEERGREERTAIKEGRPEGLCLSSDLNKTKYKKTSLGNWGKVSANWVLFIDAILRKHLPFVSLDPSLPFSTQPWVSRGGRVWGMGAELGEPGNKYSNSTLPPPFDSLLGLPIGQPNWKPLTYPPGNHWPTQMKTIGHPSWKLLASPTGNHWLTQLEAQG